ncbi:choice-of-anchor J domain-containing protein [Massilia sp. TN1-12]|uniref:choice-of-anchor J domain-containing protein n=1 Tax=Massilia paldalensis TaxID=3377675 RepID=UPI00384B9877
MMMKKAFAGLALAGMAMSAQASIVTTEGFDTVYGKDGLAAKGWLGVDTGSTVLNGWFGGNPDTFAAQSGAATSYVAAGYQLAGADGTLSSWLLSPLFDATGGATVTFWLRAEALDGYYDQVNFGFNLNGEFVNMTPVSVVPTDGWTQYTAVLGADTVGMARFGVQYVGDANTADYVGLDNVTITSVPEPASLALLAFGALGLGIARRRRA